MFWPEVNISPYVSCAFWKTLFRVFPRHEILPVYLKFNKESNEHSLNKVRQGANIVSGSFPVLEATYAIFFGKFELSGEN